MRIVFQNYHWGNGLYFQHFSVYFFKVIAYFPEVPIIRFSPNIFSTYFWKLNSKVLLNPRPNIGLANFLQLLQIVFCESLRNFTNSQICCYQFQLT